MSLAPAQGPHFWQTVSLLLRSARRRFNGRRLRQQQLLNQRSGKTATNFGFLGTLFGVLFMLVVHGLAVGTLYVAIHAGERLAVERRGKVVVSRTFLTAAEVSMAVRAQSCAPCDHALDESIQQEARHMSRENSEPAPQIAARLQSAYCAQGPAAFVSEGRAEPGIKVFAQQRWQGLPAMLGSAVVLWWALMLAFQGEGLELDLQRRRHPMWEWLFSHPVPVGAVFLAEMLSPLAANPVYWTAPVFVGGAYGLVYGPALGLLAACAIGIPLAVALGCMGKALEIGVALRVAPRQRGAVIGVMSWMGYASMMVLFLGTFAAQKLSTLALSWIAPLARLPWPWLGLFLGLGTGGRFSFALGMGTCWAAAALLLAAAVWLTVWGTQRGLAGAFGAAVARPSGVNKAASFGREPLYRKEFLWFARDRSAIVQSILIPLTVASVQLFNLRGVMKYAQGEWNYLSGAAIIFGTYFLWILGPKSLASEGTALWIALTWPRGLESLLKAKAWLWSMLSNALVALILIYAVVLFPQAWWRIALVGIAWIFFGRSMAEKSVTLVTVTSESGEVQKLRGGTRAGAQLGMLTFAIGVLTQQWNLAVMGIVYSYITAAAMWQNFRARLPYLYDPWSEVVPDPPTLVHALVAVSVMVELGAVLTGILIAFLGRENAPAAQAASYAISAVVVSFGTVNFMENRGVSLRDVLVWDDLAPRRVPKTRYAGSMLSLNQTVQDAIAEPETEPWWLNFGKLDRPFLLALLAAAGLGLGLGAVGLGYQLLLEHLPLTAEMVRKAQQAQQQFPGWRLPYLIMAVGFAPWAEEYLFRGLMFRALDREWGGWQAVAGSAAFFAMYHPFAAWPMVFSLGALNALLFKRTGRLAPAIVLHMLYNAVVLSR